MLTEQLQWVERENKAEHDELLKTMIEYKVDGEKELARRKELGVEGPKLYPHPDHIHVNLATGEVEIRGPMCKEEEDYVETFELKVKTEAAIADAELELAEKHCGQVHHRQAARSNLCSRPGDRSHASDLEKATRQPHLTR
jgi:hypothetical protein